MCILAPSLLAADFSKLKDEVNILNEAKTPWLHLDIMDYCFVPNLSFGAGIVKSLRPYTQMIFDAHLMVIEPEKYIKDFKNAGADYFTFHLEATDNPQKVIDEIRANGMKVGISIKPKTSVSDLEPYLEYLDLILIMSVEPGFGGQKFMWDMLEKIQWLKAKKQEGYNYLIEIDGGINRETAKAAVKSGAEVLVAGTAVFGATDLGAEVAYYSTLE
ncbi:MAG: ribulose-phosphate 3-epimerase [Clostridiales bacterium]